jgi:uncharacterized membrane protein
VRHQHAASAFAVPHAVAGEQSQQALLVIASFGELILALVLFLSGLAPLAQEMPEQHASGAPAAQDAAADQQTHEASVLIAPLGELVLALVFFLASFASLAQEMPEQHAPGTPAAQDAAADQQTHEASVLIAPLGELILALVFVLPGLAPLAQQMPEQHAAYTSAAQHAAADQQTHEPAFLIGVFFAGSLLTLVVLFLRLPAFAQKMRQQQVAQAAPTQ